ncbi:protein Mlp1p [Trichomonascus vanleenenianus]|uniref:protein Mlp1p n=1 Tax=Trichomonascus vanleenenianus TaxID=2268995 RepID=UPI003ECB8D28
MADKEDTGDNAGSPAPLGNPVALQPEPAPVAMEQEPKSMPLAEKSDTSRPLEFVAQFLSLSVSFVTDLPEAVLQKITARANEMEALKSQHMLDEVNYEQSIHSANNKVSTMQSRLDDATKRAEELDTRISVLETTKKNLEAELTEAKSSSSGLSVSQRELQDRIDTLAREKRQTLDLFERKNSEIRELRSELDAANGKLLSNRKTIVELEEQSQQARTAQMSARLKEQQLTQQVESLKRANDWFESELAANSNEFKKFRSEKLAKISHLTTEYDSLKSSFDARTSAYEKLEAKHNDTSAKYDDALVKIRDLKNELAVSEENFKSEMAAQHRLSDLWKRSAEDSKQRVKELERSLEQERQKDVADLAKWRAAAENEKKRADRLESQLNTLELQLEEAHGGGLLQQQGQQQPNTPHTPIANRTPGGVLGSGSLSVLSPSAHIISEIQKGGGSLVQLYSDFQETKNRLERERHKNETLRREMDHILEEMETHAPAILAEREENQRLEVELAELSVQLEKAGNETEEVKAQLKLTQVKLRDSDREQGLLNQQLRDLSRQVQHLLIQVQMLTDSEPPLSADEHSALQQMLNGNDNVVESDTDRLISQRLVLFKNIIELQQQNEHLLKVTRELGQKMEREEEETKQKLLDLESAAIEDAKKAIVSLQEDLDRAQTKTEALQRERDMFRRMLGNREQNHSSESAKKQAQSAPSDFDSAYVQQLIKQNEESTANLKESQLQLDMVRNESSVTIKTLNEQIASLNEKRSDLQVMLSKAQSQLELANERYKNLSDNLKMIKSENTEIKRRNQALQETVAKQDLRTEHVAAELVDAKSMAESIKSENVNLKAERSLWKSIEDRQVKEISELLQERGRLNAVISNLQSMEAQRQSSDDEAKRRLVSQIETLETQVSNLEKRLASETEEVKRISVRKDTESSEFQQRIERLQQSLDHTKAQYETTKSSRDEIQNQLQKLQIDLSAANDRLALYQSSGDENPQARLADEITQLKSRLQVTEIDLNGAREKAEEMTEVAAAAEESLKGMVEAFDEFKKDSERIQAQKESEIASLREQLVGTNELLSSTNSELASFREEEQKKINAIEEEKRKLEQELRQIRAEEARVQELYNEVKKDIETQSKIASEAEANYQQELVKHANAASAAQELRSEVGQLKEKLLKFESEAKNAKSELDNAQSSWQSQVYSYEDQIERLKSRCNDLVVQNKVLLDQLESFSTRTASKLPEGAERFIDEPNSTTNNLREVIGHLKREKEIVDTHYEVALQETKRLKQQLTHVQSELDQAKVDLERERQREGETNKLSEDHQKVIQQLNDINILRESNSQLRSQSDYYSKRVTELEGKLEEITNSVEPLKERLREAEAANEVHENEIKLANEENMKWKERAQQILQKYERIDPAELQALKNEVEELRQKLERVEKERDELEKQLRTEKEAAATVVNQKNSQIREIRHKSESEIADLKNQLNSAQTEGKTDKDALVAERDKLSGEHEALKLKFDRLKTESLEKLKKRRDEAHVFKNQITDQKAQIDKLTKELAEIKQNTGEVGAANDINLDKLKKELDATKAALEESKKELETKQNESNAAIEEKQKRIETLEGEVNKVSDEITDLRAQKDAAIAASNSTGENQNVEHIAQLTAEKSKLEKDISNVQTEMEQLKQQLQTSQSQLETAQTEIAEAKQAAQEAESKAQQQPATEGGSDEAKKDWVSPEQMKVALDEAIEKEKEEFKNAKQEWDTVLRKEVRDQYVARLKESAEKTVRAKVEEHRIKIQEQMKQERERLEKRIAELESSKATATGEDGSGDNKTIEKLEQEYKAKVEQLKIALEKEKEEAVQKKVQEMTMRNKLLENKIKKLESEKNGSGTSSSGATPSAGTSFAGAASRAAGITTTAGKSNIPRPQGVGARFGRPPNAQGGAGAAPTTSGNGAPRPMVQRPMFKRNSATSTAPGNAPAGKVLGNKRPAGDPTNQQEQKRQKG